MPATAVFVDCDSTLSSIEGIDELARRAGLGAQTAALTDQAMAGEVDMASVFAQRMQMVQPDREALAWLAGHYAATEVAHAGAALRQLAAAGCAVTVLSAGLQQAVEPFVEGLAPGLQVCAVPVRLDAQGGYAGYDEDCPLIADAGKALLCERLAAAAGARLMIMVGDGANDAATVAVGATFIQFAGVRDRPEVAGRASRRICEPSLQSLPEIVRKIAGD